MSGTMNARTTNLSPAKRWLVQRIHQTYFGTMHNLMIRDGEPVIDPPPRIRQAYKLGGKRNPPKIVAREFALKEQHLELLELIENKRNGVIAKLTIQEGLPFLVEWEND